MKIVPIETGEKVKKSDLKLFGVWKDDKKTEDVDQYIQNVRKGREQ